MQPFAELHLRTVRFRDTLNKSRHSVGAGTVIIATISSAGSELEGMKPRSHDLVDNFVSVQLAVHKLDMLIAKKNPNKAHLFLTV